MLKHLRNFYSLIKTDLTFISGPKQKLNKHCSHCRNFICIVSKNTFHESYKVTLPAMISIN